MLLVADPARTALAAAFPIGIEEEYQKSGPSTTSLRAHSGTLCSTRSRVAASCSSNA